MATFRLQWDMKKTKKIGVILAIDTSCDDTAAAILAAELPITNYQLPNNKVKILSNVVSSQVRLHAKYGGVYPSLAKREHQKNLALVLTKALREAGLLKSKIKSQNSKLQIKNQKLEDILEREDILRPKAIQFLTKYQKPKIDAIAVTVGPGLEPCLWQGVNFARALAFYWNVPVIPVNHIEAHLLANFIDEKNSKNSFPMVGLVVSGGHTELILIKNSGARASAALQYEIIGETLDDAAGECFDKTARILGLGYPGGPAIAAEAAIAANYELRITNYGITLPRPMINCKNFNFSFSGLKTAVLYSRQKQSAKIQKSPRYKQAMAYEIQQAIIDVLLKKTFKAARFHNVKTIILGGGVAANEELRQQFFKHSQQSEMDFWIPSKSLCTDNAAMVAMAGFCNQRQAMNWKKITANANLKL
jgi:N6-L-threonylcarbamoyladenine synthase